MLDFMQSVLNKDITQTTNWGQFARRVRVDGCELLKNLDSFSNSILVAGCQRSGTTALSRLITESEGMTNFWFGQDDELDAALILAGRVRYENQGRHCFQTTYIDNNYYEYFEHTNYKMIWVIRNPYSVVYSMLNNWKTAALNRLFKNCGSKLLESKDIQRYDKFGVLGIPRIKRASLSYNAKVSQVFDLKNKLSEDVLMIVEYDDLIQKKRELLPVLYSFLNLNYHERYANKLNNKSLQKAHFSEENRKYIESICYPLYCKAKNLVTIKSEL